MGKTKSTIEVDLNDPRAARIADAISNKTGKKILHTIAESGEISGSEVASKLSLPLNTVTYNLKKLTEAGLIDKSKRAFWSSKGKKMDLYTISNRKIVISPKSITRGFVAGVVGVLAVVAIALLIMSNNQIGLPPIIIDEDGQVIIGDNLNSFESVDEIEEFLEENSAGSSFDGGFAKAADGVQAEASVAGAAADSETQPKANDYSGTNVQVQNVDEPDIVKNDGAFIYTVVGKKVVIVDAFPARGMGIVSELEFDGGNNVMNIFVNGDRLVVFTQENKYVDSGVRCSDGIVYGVRCGGYSKQTTRVYVYDITDRSDPDLEDEYELDGSYRDARMIDDQVYVISNKWIQRNWFSMPTYSVNGLKKSVAADEVKSFRSDDGNYMFTVVGAIDLDNGDLNKAVYLMGTSGSIYVSESNIYLTYQKRLGGDYKLEKYVDDVVEEVLPNDELRKVRGVMDSDERYWEKSQKIEGVLDGYMSNLTVLELFEFNKDFENRLEKYSEEIARDAEMTVIHKIEIDDGNIVYQNAAEVPGRILNQFSMDEYDDYFRIATTTGGWNRDKNLNHIFVLDKNLDLVGSVDDLAEGERIYSARFMGDRAYMVTFRQTDPLFAIDLSDPENPAVLGELKITGYSRYLHPYDKDHLIGIGMEATDQGRVQGVKISLFDVSDLSDPREVDTYEITKGKWSYSDAVYDHKAVLFDRVKNLLVIPVNYNIRLADKDLPEDAGARAYQRYRYWQGAYVFDIDTGNIDLRGAISHREEDSDSYYYTGGEYVRRSLYIGDVLYTISQSKIKANGLEDLDDISEVDLGYEEPDYRYYGEGGIAVADSVDSVSAARRVVKSKELRNIEVASDSGSDDEDQKIAVAGLAPSID